ncbi:hypothetical protein [Actinoplanes sp. NPDC049265]|uniref:hypothetical protein n=1 Tax=Actinoplanes sp. NPDC049265 TaxID=3363902 RepID=UPI0037158ABF
MSDNPSAAGAPTAAAGLQAMSELMSECIEFADRLLAVADLSGNVHVKLSGPDHHDGKPHVRMAW